MTQFWGRTICWVDEQCPLEKWQRAWWSSGLLKHDCHVRLLRFDPRRSISDGNLGFQQNWDRFICPNLCQVDANIDWFNLSNIKNLLLYYLFLFFQIVSKIPKPNLDDIFVKLINKIDNLGNQTMSQIKKNLKTKSDMVTTLSDVTPKNQFFPAENGYYFTRRKLTDGRRGRYCFWYS